MFQVTAGILAASARPRAAVEWVQADDNDMISFDELGHCDPGMASLDSKLFAALLIALSSRGAGATEQELCLRARIQCMPGAGRQLLRLITVEFRRDSAGRRQRSLRMLLSLRPAMDSAQLETTLLRFETLYADVRGTRNLAKKCSRC